MKNFLYISKDINGKFWISARARHFLKGSLSKKKFWDFGFLVSDPSKKWSDNPETKNFLYISKSINGKFSILRLSDHFLKGSLSKKIFWAFSFLVSDPSKKWSDNPEMKNFLYINKKINGKFSILRLSGHFLKGSLTKKLKSQNFFYLVTPSKNDLTASKLKICH